MRQIRQRKIEEEVDRDWWYGGMVVRISDSSQSDGYSDSLIVRRTR